MRPASLLDDLNLLQVRVVQALRQAPGAAELYLFGSRLLSPGDPYADLDFELVSADMEATLAAWPDVLGLVAALELAWPIEPGAHAVAVLLAGTSPYHKLDIGVRPLGTAARLAGPLQLVWRQQPPAAPFVLPLRSGYRPEFGSIGHTLFDDLLGAIRYVKARRRNQPLTCLRFMRSKPERLLQLWAERDAGWSAEPHPLTTWDYKALDAALPTAARDVVLAHLDWSAPATMDRALIWFTQQIASVLAARAAARGETLPHGLIERQLAFVRRELEILE
ncbi:MAG TPA: hypothetical protein VFT99_13170 [Roseiflexaceae bacterium]|nr:hypothetical protein [Roseiflexaceae bacterium]